MDLSGLSTMATPHSSVYSSDQINHILSGDEGEGAFLNKPTADSIKRRLVNERKQLINSELHLLTLREYYRVSRIPRGLRTHLRPILFPENQEFLNKFMEIANRFSMDIMLLNMEFLQKDTIKINTRVQEHEERLKLITSAQEYDKFLDQIKGDLYKYRLNIEETKRQKWSRDEEDYTKGNIYKRLQPEVNKFRSQKKRRFQRPRGRRTDFTDTDSSTEGGNGTDFLGSGLLRDTGEDAGEDANITNIEGTTRNVRSTRSAKPPVGTKTPVSQQGRRGAQKSAQ
ncbi:uncharacterized protein LOC122939181 [Bufo gargarizans]|uniref:uncharacterized protein LOC122939181 n=1 Tax=Bufo gargarizans TaxID=30331 RepID=UPI001CF44442|nr:uncharacterized protein LOC122939181 [Bufo gargarizans]